MVILPGRKRSVLENEPPPILNPATPYSFSITTYAIFLVALGAILTLTYFWIGRSERKRREAFLEAHKSDALKANRHNPNVVYRIEGEEDESYRATLIWRDKAPVKGEAAFLANRDNFADFEPSNFRLMHTVNFRIK